MLVDAAADSDASPTDASTDAGDASGASVTLLSYSFDDVTTCNDGSFNSALSETANGRTDANACKVCGLSASSDSFSYSVDVPGAAAVVGAHYHATAWYRNPSSGATAMSVAFALRSLIRQPFDQVEVAPSFAQIGADWRRIDADLVLTKPADLVDVYISETYAAGVCFIFDDLVITRVD